MKRTWQISRQFQAQPDGEQRWDRAYQAILQWALTAPAATPTEPLVTIPTETEVNHAHRCVCPGVHAPASRESEH